MENTKFVHRLQIARNMSPEFAEYALQNARQTVGKDLYNRLFSQKLPMVVDIDERVYPSCSEYYEDELRIEVTLTPVQYQKVVLPDISYSSNYLIAPPSIFKRIKHKFNKLFRR